MSASEEKITVGFEGHFQERSIELAPGDIRPYQPADKLEEVGRSRDRLDGPNKATGRAKYASDMQLPGMLYGKILRAPHPNADIRSIDLSPALESPGVEAAISFVDLFETNSVRYAGQGVAAVAARSEREAVEALTKIVVEYEVRPFAVTKEDALREGAPQVGRGRQTNIVEPRRRRGRKPPEPGPALEAISNAPLKCEGEFETQVQTHSPLETHGLVAVWESDTELLCYASTQATFGVRGELQRWFPGTNIRVKCEYVGGGFGSKFSAGREGVAAVKLAQLAKKPVHLLLDRREEQTDAGNRPDSKQKITMGLEKDGTIVGYYAETIGTPGSGGRGAGANNAAIYDLGTTYKIDRAVRTNTGGARALRAPGWPQGVFALEGMMDRGAEIVDMDPIAFRVKNDFHPIRPHQYERARAISDWDAKRAKKPGSDPGVVKRGIGVGSSVWFAAGGRGARALCRIHRDGTVEIRNGAQDIGTGTRTIMGQVCAEELGIAVSEVQVFIGDTADPQGPGSGGSTTAPTLMPVVRLASYRAKEELLEAVAEKHDWTASELDLQSGEVVRKDGKPLPVRLDFKAACATMLDDQIEVLENRRKNFEGLDGTNAGVQIAEVAVDTETGEVRVERVVALADAGKLINPKLAESQVRGGVIQGTSYALFERRVMDRIAGKMVNADLENYKIAGALDVPKIKVELTDVYQGLNNTNVMGLGEPPIVATAAAIANAVHHAIGVRIDTLPLTPKRVLAALAQKESAR